MAQHNVLGEKGEQAAADFMKNKGYKILKRNWTKHRHEIDIIAENEEYIIFVEVKTRTHANGETLRILLENPSLGVLFWQPICFCNSAITKSLQGLILFRQCGMERRSRLSI